MVLLQDETRKQTTNTYIMDQQDYPIPYPMCPGYEMQLQPNMAHKTHTLPHPHHHHPAHYHDKNRARDDQSLGYHGNMSGKFSTTIAVYVEFIYYVFVHKLLRGYCIKN